MTRQQGTGALAILATSLAIKDQSIILHIIVLLINKKRKLGINRCECVLLHCDAAVNKINKLINK